MPIFYIDCINYKGELVRVDQDYIKKIYHYDPDTGDFTRKIDRGIMYKAGEVAGSIQKNGYIHIMIQNKIFKAHRLAWMYVYGYMPSGPVDHINRIRSDNRISNLRISSVKLNAQNRSISKNNTSGYPGVRYLEKIDKWMARIGHNGDRIYLGCYETAELAHEAYLEKAEELWDYGAPNKCALS